MDFGPDAQEPRPILRRHRVDGVCDQVQQHLLELDTISSDLRYVCIRRCLDQYAVPLQIGAQQCEGLSDHFVDVERSSASGVITEDSPNAFDHRCRAMAISDDLLECRLRFIEVGRRAIKPAQPLCVPKTLSVLMTQWNHLSWWNDRAVLFRSDRAGI